jgi:hypothetical protein
MKTINYQNSFKNSSKVMTINCKTSVKETLEKIDKQLEPYNLEVVILNQTNDDITWIIWKKL